ncbi:MAG: CCA tRNA nucleotidyltransferase [Coleofasciculaceae cyanobacterium]
MYASNFKITASVDPNTWPLSLDLLPKEAYLVGGAVRDALLKRRSDYLDLDFVLPGDAIQIARNLANYYSAGFVVLDAERQIARVVFDRATVDLAKQEGDSLETDLQRRDFTINAIAYNPHTEKFIDPFQGISDLQNRIIRMVKAANLEDDPLRLLRGYRQAAQLNFTIEPETKSVMRQLAGLLGTIAAERVQVELGYLLKSSQGTPWLTEAWQDKLLQSWFPDANQGLAQIAAIDRAAVVLEANWQELGIKLHSAPKIPTSPLSKSASLLSLAKLASLLPSEPEAAAEQLQRLKYSRAEIQAVVTVLKYLPQLIIHESSEMSIREQFFFFKNVGVVFPALVVSAVAAGMPVESLTTLIERYLNPDDQVAYPKALITGHDLMQRLNIPAGQQIGKLLGEIQLATAEGKIATQEQALELAAKLMTNH